MAYFFFVWTPRALEKISEHGVTLEEVEEVISHPDRIVVSRTTGRPVAFGATGTGKYLACVYEAIDGIHVQPITAFEVED